MHTEEIRYSDGDLTCIGYLASPGKSEKPVPGVLICHAWGGRSPFECDKAEKFAGLGVAGFALDIYGEARQGSSPEENATLMQPFLDDRAALRQRLQAGLAALTQRPEVDSEKLIAVGYCFGGLCVLDLARSGADLKGVISYHGLFVPAEGIPNEKIRAKVLALHGHEDPMVPPEQVLAFEQEMTQSGADWQVHAYGNTYHAFTNPQANDPDMGVLYNADADRRSWETTLNFLKECFAL